MQAAEVKYGELLLLLGEAGQKKQDVAVTTLDKTLQESIKVCHFVHMLATV